MDAGTNTKVIEQKQLAALAEVIGWKGTAVASMLLEKHDIMEIFDKKSLPAVMLMAV